MTPWWIFIQARQPPVQVYLPTRLFYAPIDLNMTDASEEDRDVQLQRASADLIADFGASLEPFLYRTNEDGTKKIRRRVRTRETERLIGLVR